MATKVLSNNDSNNNKFLLQNNNKVLVDNEVNALRIENTNTFSFGFTSNGPIIINWGDGSSSVLDAKIDKFNISKNYSNNDNWNIIISNTENITELWFGSYYSGNKNINTNVSWFQQFNNCKGINLIDASFDGELGAILDKMKKLIKLDISYNILYGLRLNLSHCKSFWTRCEYISIIRNVNYILGNLLDLNLSLKCSYIYLHNIPKGRYNNILKNGYSDLTYLYIFSYESDTDDSIINFDDWQIPDTLINITELRYTYLSMGSLSTFNFKNLIKFAVAGNINVDLSNNSSFNAFASRASVISIRDTGYNIKVPINALNNTSYSIIRLYTAASNLSYGDISSLLQKTTTALWIYGEVYNEMLTGSIPETTSLRTGSGVVLSGLNITSTRSALLNLISKCGDFVLRKCPNINADISGADFSNAIWYYFNTEIRYMDNLSADVTTFKYGGHYYGAHSNLMKFAFSRNPKFIGDLSAYPLWTCSMSTLDLSWCAYTNIPGFVQKIFINRNTCLRHINGKTIISVNNNIDNNLLTGTYQQPNLGTYTGNINDLTEDQIDNLSNGLDYTGLSTSIAWTDKEKIWFLTKCTNSSTDTSLRYRVTINY